MYKSNRNQTSSNACHQGSSKDTTIAISPQVNSTMKHQSIFSSFGFTRENGSKV